jgi:prepilin-type N-terminal cleavage/methylation domain-containing protein/prepilin-type processing-associated H-X9-DG protein
MRRRGFTLIELLVVIAIIAILAAILFPVFAQAREKARAASCLSNQKQVALGLMMYAQDYDETYPGDNISTQQRWGTYYWMFLTIPYIKNNPTNFNKPKGGVFQCPSDISLPQELAGDRTTMVWPEPANSWGLTTLAPNGFIQYWNSYSINEWLTDTAPNMAAWDAPASSLMFLEANDSETEGDELDELLSTPKQFGGRGGPGHSGGLNFAYLDGHVKFRRLVYVVDTSKTIGKWIWNWPTSSKKGGSGANAAESDCGAWTPTSSDDEGCVGKQ